MARSITLCGPEGQGSFFLTGSSAATYGMRQAYGYNSRSCIPNDLPLVLRFHLVLTPLTQVNIDATGVALET